MTEQVAEVKEKTGKKFFVCIEGTEFEWDDENITVPQIRELGNLPADQPVIEVDADNNERTLAEDEIITLKPGHRFGKKVSYKRGLNSTLDERMLVELDLLKQDFPEAELSPDKRWIRIPNFKFRSNIWSRESSDICFQVQVGYPGQAPYGFCVESGFRLKDGQKPDNYTEPVETPFEGQWGQFSWAHVKWFATGDVVSGNNLRNFVSTIQERLAGGK